MKKIEWHKGYRGGLASMYQSDIEGYIDRLANTVCDVHLGLRIFNKEFMGVGND